MFRRGYSLGAGEQGNADGSKNLCDFEKGGVGESLDDAGERDVLVLS